MILFSLTFNLFIKELLLVFNRCANILILVYLIDIQRVTKISFVERDLMRNEITLF